MNSFSFVETSQLPPPLAHVCDSTFCAPKYWSWEKPTKSWDPEYQNENFNRIFWMEILCGYGFSYVHLAGDGLVLSLSKQGVCERCAFHAETPGRC